MRVALASATNDETVFGDPRRFDPGRADLWHGDSRGGLARDGAASHLGFGLGSHFCAGYKLSRLEALRGDPAALPRQAADAGRPVAARCGCTSTTSPSRALRATLTQGGSS